MDNRIEQQQVRIKLTDDPETIAQLVANKRLIKRKDGKYEYTVTFDSMPITIVTGVPIQLGHSAARSLIAVSYVIVGDHLTGEQRPALLEAGTFSLGEATAENICEYCGAEFEGKNVKKQKAQHLASCEEFAKLLENEEELRTPKPTTVMVARPTPAPKPQPPTLTPAVVRPNPQAALMAAQAALAASKAAQGTKPDDGEMKEEGPKGEENDAS